MLVHEARGPSGTRGPRARVRNAALVAADGKQIAVHDAPTSFGRLSYTVRRRREVDAWVDVPESRSLRR